MPMSVSRGAQENRPVTGSMLAPGGAFKRAKVKALAGTSKSVALFITVRFVAPARTLKNAPLGGLVNTGAVFISFTMMMKFVVTVKGEPITERLTTTLLV